MKFLVDAQLPRRLAQLLQRRGHEARHTLDLSHGNRTPDSTLSRMADETGAVMITKDSDFVVSHMLNGSPSRLLVIATGNCRNQELMNLLEKHLPDVERALVASRQVILTRERLVVEE